MPVYTVTVATGSQWFAGTDDYIYITLVGTERCSERTLLDKPLYNDFERGAVSLSLRMYVGFLAQNLKVCVEKTLTLFGNGFVKVICRGVMLSDFFRNYK